MNTDFVIRQLAEKFQPFLLDEKGFCNPPAGGEAICYGLL